MIIKYLRLISLYNAYVQANFATLRRICNSFAEYQRMARSSPYFSLIALADMPALTVAVIQS
jgi:hypothetical protein